MTDDTEEWLTVEEVAKKLKVHVSRVRRWIREGSLIAADFGRDYRIHRDDYNNFVQSRKTRGSRDQEEAT